MKKYQKKLDTQMSGIKDPMSFLYGFFHRKCQKKLDTKMSGIKDPISFLYGFSMEMSKKAQYPNVTNKASDIISIWIFP